MPQDPWAVVKHEDAPVGDPWAVVQPTTPTGIPQQMLEANRARNANPTQFEQDRNPENQSGIFSSAIGEIGNLVSNIPSAVNGLMHPIDSAMHSAADLAINDQLRAKNGRSAGYRAAVAAGAPLGINATGMEQQADVGNARGVVGIGLGDAAPYVAGAAAGPTMKAIGKVIPNAARAGETMNGVRAAAGSIPIDVADVGNTALRTQDLAAAGGSMPKVVRDFLRRVSDPAKPPLTYAEAQDFYSNATRLSADEFNRLTPTMQRQMAEFTDNLAKSMKGAADQVGMGDQLVQGKAEYSAAMRNAARVELIKKALVKSIPYGAAAATGYGIYKSR